ncbi:unnamed protein product [Pleuronectes platessa]|uniref:Uncharacterized protein n=1 Tax=Pleuronectes platessa TaxID=8262 RepID=A0A9N7UPT0_PLEPL|nr:unnamed protein product [Pleuronectes platessa]
MGTVHTVQLVCVSAGVVVSRLCSYVGEKPGPVIVSQKTPAGKPVRRDVGGGKTGTGNDRRWRVKEKKWDDRGVTDDSRLHEGHSPVSVCAPLAAFIQQPKSHCAQVINEIVSKTPALKRGLISTSTIEPVNHSVFDLQESLIGVGCGDHSAALPASLLPGGTDNDGRSEGWREQRGGETECIKQSSCPVKGLTRDTVICPLLLCARSLHTSTEMNEMFRYAASLTTTHHSHYVTGKMLDPISPFDWHMFPPWVMEEKIMTLALQDQIKHPDGNPESLRCSSQFGGMHLSPTLSKSDACDSDQVAHLRWNSTHCSTRCTAHGSEAAGTSRLVREGEGDEVIEGDWWGQGEKQGGKENEEKTGTWKQGRRK